jgi:hypothetical protein
MPAFEIGEKRKSREPESPADASLKHGCSFLEAPQTEGSMFYRKNIRGWEQVARVVGGIVMIAGGLLGLPGDPLGYGIAAAGLFTAATGIVGFCPACAMVGRKLG